MASFCRIEKASPLRFRCHTGHAYSANTLLAGTSEGVEDSLWNAIRSIEESVRLLRHMAEQLPEGADERFAEEYLKRAQAAQGRADLVRQAVMHHQLARC